MINFSPGVGQIKVDQILKHLEFLKILKKINLVNKRKILLIISSTYNYVTGEGTGEILSMRTKNIKKILDELIKKMPNFILENIFIRGNYVGEKLRSSKITSNIKKKYKNLKFQNSKKPSLTFLMILD